MNGSRDESGFSYIDVMIAITILLVGIMSLVGAMTSAVVMTTKSQDMLAAKQYASSTVEAIFSARDIPNLLGWDAIGNATNPATPRGVFPSGEEDIWPTAGRDGIVGTTDDSAGPDGIKGNTDDGTPVPGYKRLITITDLPDPDRPNAAINLRRIDVTITFAAGGKPHTETFTSYAANYRTTPL